MGFKRQDGRGITQPLRFFHRITYQSLMPQMDTVEITHGSDGSCNRKPLILYMTKDLHGFPSSSQKNQLRAIDWETRRRPADEVVTESTESGWLPNYDSSDFSRCLALPASGDCGYFSTTSWRISRALTFSPSSANAKPCFKSAAGTFSPCGYLLRTASNSIIAWSNSFRAYRLSPIQYCAFPASALFGYFLMNSLNRAMAALESFLSNVRQATS